VRNSKLFNASWCCVALSAVFWSGAAAAQDLVLRHGLSTSQYQSAFDELVGKGYRLRQVSGYTVGGRTRYAGIWAKETGPLWTARYGLPAADYQNLFDDFTKQGYRLTYVSGYEVHGAVRYTAIWEQRTGPRYGARHGMTSEEYQQTYDYHVRQGFRPLHVSAYTVRGEPRFAAIFEQSTGPAVSARHNLSAAEYESAFVDHTKQGFRLKSVSGYRVAGSVRYAALWEKSDVGGWQARLAVPADSFEKVAEDLSSQGYAPVFVSGFVRSGGAAINGIWATPSSLATPKR